MSAVTTSRVTEDTSIADPLFYNLSRVYSPFPGDRRSQCTSDVPPLLCELRCQKASCLKLLCLRWYRLSPADLRRAPIEPCRRPSSVEIWVRYGRSIAIAAAIETPVSMIPRYPSARCTRRSAVFNSFKKAARKFVIGQIHGCLSVAIFWNSSPPPGRLLGAALALHLRAAPGRLRPDASSRQTGVAVLTVRVALGDSLPPHSTCAVHHARPTSTRS